MFSVNSLLWKRCLFRQYSGLLKPLEVAKVVNSPNVEWMRSYGKKKSCRRALVDIPKQGDPKCPLVCDTRKKKKKGVLHRIKLKIIEGGTNFGTPFRRLFPSRMVEVEEDDEEEEPMMLPAPEYTCPEVPEPRPGVQVSILGADTCVGQYVALLLKQCPCFRRLRLYEANDTSHIPNSPCGRDMYQIVQDLQHIDTNCVVQAYSCHCGDLELCLQNSDIVLILDSVYVNEKMSFEERFNYHAPIVKSYADMIAHECPKAFVIVCATPVDCMVPLIAETFKETGWYDRRKLMGSVAVPEMRASTLAARALCLDPSITRVPCIGGTEGKALVPLFSKAVQHFEFCRSNALMMTETIRQASTQCACGCCCVNPDLSEAHALALLVKNVALALLCQDIPTVSGFVETDCSQIISPARFFAGYLELGGIGISVRYDMPLVSEVEQELAYAATIDLNKKMNQVMAWYNKNRSSSPRLDTFQKQWFFPAESCRLKDCAYSAVT